MEHPLPPRIGGWQLASGHDTSSSGATTAAAAAGAEEEWGRAEEAQAAAMAADMRLHIEAGVTAVDCGDIYTGVGRAVLVWLLFNAFSERAGLRIVSFSSSSVVSCVLCMADLFVIHSRTRTQVECLIGRFLRDHRPTSIYPQPVQVP